MHFAMICLLSNHGAKIHIFFDTDAFVKHNFFFRRQFCDGLCKLGFVEDQEQSSSYGHRGREWHNKR